MLKGSVVSIPSELVPSKNSTQATKPSLSWALTSIVTKLDALNEAPLVGLVIETTGGALLTLWTVTLPIMNV